MSAGDVAPPAGPGVRSGLWVPLFGELAEPRAVMRLAAEAEEAGWHGVFVWDQLAWREPVTHVGDPWITLAAVATATERVRLGPMVTPLPRRRPVKVARETAALDRLSAGRLTLGVGIASDRFAGELSRTGEQLDDRVRGAMLDEGLGILTAAWSGQVVRHAGTHYTVDAMRLLPRPVQRPGVPVWVAGLTRSSRPLHRAARFDGFFPANLEHPDQLAEIAATLAGLRPPGGRFDLVVGPPVGVDPLPYVRAGATWWLPELSPEDVTLDTVRGVLRDGPLTP
jgi:alkanesulfonate monooxygenase SsuD/methylene tetrahydromethanopterin reductase-like flavin-dependent oxidoreductase (luciferase family)